MRILEIKQLVPEASGCYLVCVIKTDDYTKEVRFLLDEPTRSSLQTILQSFANCRCRILPEIEKTDDRLIVKGTISIVHARWMRRVSFLASPAFFDQVKAELDEGLGSSDQWIALFQQAESVNRDSASSLRQHSLEQHGYISGLDGLRAIAIVAVLAYHFNMDIAPGGFFGVTMFFVLSGYLITNALLKEWSRHQHINVKRFWMRRANRLLPAMMVMLFVVAVWVYITDDELFGRLGIEVMAALLYVSNWFYIFNDVSYFEQFETLTPLKHLWSLGIEEQFYFIWPVLVLIGLRSRKKWAVILVALMCTVASVAAMAMLYEPGNDASRVYYGTDTRAFCILIGALLAFVLHNPKRLARFIGQPSRLLDAAGAMAVAGIIVMIGYMNEYENGIYPVGMMILSLLTAVAVMAVVRSDGWLSSIMGYAPLRWLGKRSYAIYLWHYPVIILTTPAASSKDGNPLVSLAQLAAILLIAAISWRLIEEPFLKGAYKRSFRIPQQKWGVGLSMGSIVLVLVILNATVFADQLKSAQAPVNEQYLSSLSVEMNIVAIQHYGGSSPTVAHANTAAAEQSETAAPSLQKGVTVIGDSVILSVQSYLQQWMPDIYVDGEVGRQMHEAPDIIARLKEERGLGQYVLIELGANGAFSKKLIDSVIDAVGRDRHIFVVNVRVPRPWQNTVNDRLAEAADKHPNVTLIDWYAHSKNNDHYFVQDGVHLTEAGGEQYAELVIKTMEKVHAARDI